MHGHLMVAVFHAGRPLQPHDLATAWSFDPAVVLLLCAAAAMYGRGMRTLWSRAGTGAGLTRSDARMFAGGWLTLCVAMLSPLHSAGGVLFSAHMLQHTLLIAVAAPLLVLGRPHIAMIWSIPMEWRRRAGAAVRARPIRRAWRALARPSSAWLLHACMLWVWHLPVAYQAALSSDVIHSLQHASFVGTALLFWWSAFHSAGARMSYGAAAMYMFGMALQSGGLGALITFAPTPWYASYGSGASAWGLTQLEDQQLAGLIMWIPASLSYLAAALYMIGAWMNEAERRAVRWQARA
jgi:putative membrane protein